MIGDGPHESWCNGNQGCGEAGCEQVGQQASAPCIRCGKDTPAVRNYRRHLYLDTIGEICPTCAEAEK